jgi:4-alpha-glucanotransferase
VRENRTVSRDTGDNQAIGSVLAADRNAGVCLHITSLPGNYGIGEIGDPARSFIDDMVRMNLGVWQFLPAGPTAYGDSPYQPLSTFAINELFIDIATCIRTGLVTSNEADSLLDLPRHTVDYGELIPRKTALLDRAAGRFHAQATSAIKSDFDRFMQSNDSAWLNDYAVYRVLKSLHNELPWTAWADEYVHRDSRALKNAEDRHANDMESIKILQFLASYQWRALREYAESKNVLLFGDMPIYIALDSSDAWANRELLLLDGNGMPTQVAGVPPDYFSADGQLWGNPVYDWSVHADTAFRWWIERLCRAGEMAGIVRIDHFRGFESYWSVPADAENARAGAWRPGPGDAMFVAMREALGKLPIVAEDLGVITPEVEALRDRHGIPGMKVLQFEVGERDFDPGDIGRNTVCYTGTHDNDTTRGWFAGSPADNRSQKEIERTRKAVLDITGGSPETIHNDLIRLAFSTKSRLAIAPMQDYLGLDSAARLNRPGVPMGNWRWRLRQQELTPALIDSIAAMVDDAGRGRPA